MKRNHIIYLLVIIGLITIVSGCVGTAKVIKETEPQIKQHSEPQSEPQSKPQSKLALFLVKDLKPYEAYTVDLDKLVLASTPILTDSDIVDYSWATHEFTLSQDVLLEQLKGSIPTTEGRAFVFVVNGERIYLGAFWTPLSSVSPPDIPIISSIWSVYDSDKTYKIDYFGAVNDPRKDQRIYEFLNKADKLKSNELGDFSIIIGDKTIFLKAWDNEVNLESFLGKPIDNQTRKLGQGSDTFSGSYIRELKFQGIDLELFSPKDNGKKFFIYSIKVKDPNFKTARGIRVRDGLGELKRVYPAMKPVPDNRTDANNRGYIIEDGTSNYIRFEVKQGLVSEIKVYHEFQ